MTHDSHLTITTWFVTVTTLFLMEGMYESARTYAQVLKDCSLPQVADWELEDVNRVIQWAEYFEKVHIRIAKKSSVIKKLDNKLREIGRDLGVRFGGEELCYDFITQHSSDYFTKCLLDNSGFPEKLKEKISSRCPHLAQQELNCISFQHLLEAKDTELLFSSLSAISEKLAPYQSDDQELLLDLRSLDAEYLRRDLAWALAGGESGKGRPCVRERLDSLARVDGGMEVILLCLLQGDKGDQWFVACGPSHMDLLDTARRATLEWLLQTAQCKSSRREAAKRQEVGTIAVGEGDDKEDLGCITDRLWHRKCCKLLAQVSVRYFDFFKEHLKFLVARTEGIERDRGDAGLGLEGDSSGAGAEDNGELSLDERIAWATAHWVELVLAGGQVKEACLALLVKESQQVSQISREEATHAGCTLTLVPLKDSVWRTVLNAIRSEKMMAGIR